MDFIKFLQNNNKYLQELLKEELKKKKDQFSFIESLIQKLALVIVEEEITSHEQSFLIRLFIKSKLNELDSIISILDEKTKLMFKIIDVSLCRYILIHTELAFFVVRQKNPRLHEKIWPTSISWEVKPDNEKEHETLREKVVIDAKTDCTKYRGFFSFHEFEQLKLEFLEFSAQFSSIDEQDLDSLKSLLALLLEFESKILSKEKKFLFFEKEFENFQKQTEEVLKEILNEGYKYEMRDCSDFSESMFAIGYTEPFSDIKRLIESLNRVLKKQCQTDCVCCFTPSFYYSRKVHSKEVLTPAMEQEICQCSAKLGELLE